MCGSTKLADVELPEEREDHHHSPVHNTFSAQFLCGECGKYTEAIVFENRRQWKKFRAAKKKR